MTELQLQQIKEVYDMLQKGLTHPLKINQVYKYLNTIQGMEVAQRVKILAINRFMMLNYQDCLNDLKKVQKAQEAQAIEESIGTIENRDKQTHRETKGNDDQQDIQGFLSKEEKEDLKSDTAGTTLEIVSNDGKKKRTRSPNGTRKPRR